MTKPFLGSESHSFPGRRLKASRLKSRCRHQNWLTNSIFFWLHTLIHYCLGFGFFVCFFFISLLGIRLFIKLYSVHPTAAKTHTSGFVKGHQAAMNEVRCVTDHLRAYLHEPAPRGWQQSYRIKRMREGKGPLQRESCPRRVRKGSHPPAPCMMVPHLHLRWSSSWLCWWGDPNYKAKHYRRWCLLLGGIFLILQFCSQTLPQRCLA